MTAQRPIAVQGLGFANAAIGLVQLAEPILFGFIVDALARGQSPWTAIGLWAVIGLFGILASVVVAVTADRFAHRQRLSAMSSAFERAITLPISYHAERGTGALIRTIVEGTSSLFATWLSFLREQCSAVVAIAFMVPVALWMEWRLALMLLALAAIYCIFNMMVIEKTSGGQSEVEAYHMQVSGRVGDTLTNVPIVQSYSRLHREAQDLKALMENLLQAQYPVLTWWGVLTVLTRATSTITMVAVFAVGTYLISIDQATVGEIVSFVGFAGLLIAKLDVLSGFITRVFMQAPTMRTFFELVDASSPILEKANAKPIRIARGEVRYEDVTFRYGDGPDGVFDLSFTVPAGSTTALVGPTGSGKTTTLALLQRLREPDQGRILIDGQPVDDVTLVSLREALAVVFQDAGLFNRSISENLRIGSPSATAAELRAAAQQAQALDFIEKKPGAFDFIVGDRGTALSGGERQRIAIARAILKNAPILLLDEATSALDTATEARIKRGLDQLRSGRTTLIIAHRLSTVADADQILVFDRGRIIERGKFDELVRLNGTFAQLVADGRLTEPAETPA
ncbi:MAG: glucan ABC transporter ATP-binding protein/ permease [Pseudomonadota bacterium]